MPPPATIDEICAALRARGWSALARRLAFLASDADLEPGETAATVASAQAFLDFFLGVTPVNPFDRLDLACSPEGCLSAYWDFPDARHASVWFPNKESARFAVTDAKGQWVKVDGGNGSAPGELAVKLVAAGLFVWHQETPDGRNWQPSTTWPDTAGVAT